MEKISRRRQCSDQLCNECNAGVFLILKLAPVPAQKNFAGIMTMMVGGITFPAASLVAVFRPEVAKTVSCSTVASMGLIVLACGGIGSAEAVAAGDSTAVASWCL